MKRLRNRGITVRLNRRIPLTGPLPHLHPDPLPRKLQLIQILRPSTVLRPPVILNLLDQPRQLLVLLIQLIQPLRLLLPQK